MNRSTLLTIAAALVAFPLFAALPAGSEKEVWSLEEAYWRYVQANDLDHYRTLWSPDFLGWPLASPEPVRRDHITDWITAHTDLGETLKSYALQPLASQANGDYVTVAYRVRLTWVDPARAEKPASLRVIHTWVRDAQRRWQIISGMAAPPNAQGH